MADVDDRLVPQGPSSGSYPGRGSPGWAQYGLPLRQPVGLQQMRHPDLGPFQVMPLQILDPGPRVHAVHQLRHRRLAVDLAFGDSSWIYPAGTA